MSQLAESEHPSMQDEWEDLDGEVARRHRPEESEDNSWTGTVVGLALASAALATIFLT